MIGCLGGLTAYLMGLGLASAEEQQNVALPDRSSLGRKTGSQPRFGRVVDARVAFNIPPQDLNRGLIAFGDKTGIQVFFEIKRVKGVQSPGVSGLLTPKEALTRLLEGTGFSYRFVNPGTITLIKNEGEAQVPDDTASDASPPPTCPNHPRIPRFR